MVLPPDEADQQAGEIQMSLSAEEGITNVHVDSGAAINPVYQA